MRVAGPEGLGAGRPIALVWGGARGIGYATATRLVDSGYEAIVADIDSVAAASAAERLSRRGTARQVVMDVGDRTGPDAVAEGR